MKAAKLFSLVLLTATALQATAQRPNRQLFPLRAYTLTEFVPIEFDEAFAMPEEFRDEAYAGIAENSRGNLIVLSRGNIPFIEFRADGAFVRSFGRSGMFNRAHGLHLAADDTIWTTDVADHVVMKLDRDGNVLMTIGTRGQNGQWDEAAGAQLFDEPNDVALDSHGNVYVAQGHTRGEPAILKFRPDGSFVTKWGARGYEEAQFAIAHAIAIDNDDIVYVADRENMRIQRFDTDGNFIGLWSFDAMVCAIHLHDDGFIYITTGYDGQLAKIDMNGRVIGAIGRPGPGNGQFVEAHGLTLDSQGNAFVTDVFSGRIQKFSRQ